MSQRVANHVCFSKVAYRTRQEAEDFLARCQARGRLHYTVCVYACPLSSHFHVGRAKRANRR